MSTKPHIREYRATGGPDKGMVITVNRQMRGVKITEHPNPKRVGDTYDLAEFLKYHDLDGLELV